MLLVVFIIIITLETFQMPGHPNRMQQSQVKFKTKLEELEINVLIQKFPLILRTMVV